MAKVRARRPLSRRWNERELTTASERPAIPTIFGSLCQPRTPIVNENTRFQLKSLESKTGCRRQVFSVSHAETRLILADTEAQSKVRESVRERRFKIGAKRSFKRQSSGVGDRVIDIESNENRELPVVFSWRQQQELHLWRSLCRIKACALTRLSCAGLKSGFNRKISWNWVIASSNRPFCKRALARL